MILYLIGGLLALSVVTGIGGYFKGRSSMEAEQREAIAEQAELARKFERDTARATFRLQENRDAENLAIGGRLAAALERLRSRPERLPPASAPACAGSTGAELSGPDAAFLERESARADRLRADLQTCRGWVEEVTKPR